MQLLTEDAFCCVFCILSLASLVDDKVQLWNCLKPKGLCTFVVSVVHLLRGVEKATMIVFTIKVIVNTPGF